jgi:hypothetical protein
MLLVTRSQPVACCSTRPGRSPTPSTLCPTPSSPVCVTRRVTTSSEPPGTTTPEHYASRAAGSSTSSPPRSVRQRKQLAKEEREAEAKARFSMHGDGHGQTHGRFTLPDHIADILEKALRALASPKAGGEGLSPHGMGLAFMDYIRRYPADQLPTAGGVSAAVVVTMTLETLLGGLKAAQLDTGTMISPGLARKLACEAGVIPVVLGGHSQPLDVGRRRRFHTKAQRIAMAVRDKGCVAMGCERPTAACDAHHLIQWANGGDTSVEGGVLLCRRHHTLAHHQDYELTHHPDGKISFHKRE